MPVKLLEHWMPPEGAGRAVGCLASTFTFEPDFFEGDCLARFLGLALQRGEGHERAFVIEQEEKLAEVRAGVLVDRSFAENRNLRWDVLPVGVPGGVQHAKISLLVWEHLVRVVVASANLVARSYRDTAEIAVALDARTGSEVPAGVFDAAFGALERLVALTACDPGRPGPARRALDTIADAGRRVAGFGLPREPRGPARVAVIVGEGGRPVLPQLDAAWRGGAVRSATVLSPFFDGAEHVAGTVGALVDRLAKTGETSLTFVVPVDHCPGRDVVRAPRALAAATPRRVDLRFQDFREGEPGLTRRLHAKALLLESSSWAVAMVGSSNFTAAGLLGARHRSNFECNVAVGAPAGTREAKSLLGLFGNGGRLEPADCEWVPNEDLDETSAVALPMGFAECLLEPGPPPALVLRFSREVLPADWTVALPSGALLLSAQAWREAGAAAEVRQPVAPNALPLSLLVRWPADGTWASASWPVNVTEPGRLPPPEELRGLPLEALLQALASTRALPEALAAALERARRAQTGTECALDPLKRYSGVGSLLHRARRFSRALSGLESRLVRPAASLDALTWRLEGPFGPVALAIALCREDDDGRLLPGELDFLLAEIALMVARAQVGELADGNDWRPARAAVLGRIAAMRRGGEVATGVTDYVAAAFEEVRS